MMNSKMWYMAKDSAGKRVALLWTGRRAILWRARLLGAGLLLIFASGMPRAQPVPVISHQAATLPQQPTTADTAEPDRLLDQARRRRENALFADDLDWAELQCREALDGYRELDHQQGITEALDELGLIALKGGRSSKALAFLDEALAATREAGQREQETQVLEHKARTLLFAHQLQRALAAGQRAFELSRDTRQQLGELRALILLGQIREELGEGRRAIERYRQALSLTTRRGARVLHGPVLERLAGAYQDIGEYRAAFGLDTQALAAYRRLSDPLGEANALAGLGEISWEMGESQRAIGYYQQALNLADEISALPLEWKLEARLARAYHQRGQEDQARASFEAATKLLASTPGELLAERSSQPIPLTPQQVFRRYVDFLLSSSGASPDVTRAWAVSDLAHAHASQELLVEQYIQIHEHVEVLTLEREQTVVHEWHDTQRAVQAPGLTQSERRSLADQLAQSQADVESFQRDIRHLGSRYAVLKYPRISGAEQVQRQLSNSGTVLLEYLLGQERSYLFVITPDAPAAAFTLPGAAEVEQAVKTYRRMLTQPSDEGDSSQPPSSSPPPEGVRLYEMLIGPARRLLKGKSRLIIVPDGLLHYLPFEALIEASDGLQGKNHRWRYLLEEAAISYLPSASLLSWLRQRREEDEGKRLLLVCLPQTSRSQSPQGQTPDPSRLPGRELETHAIKRAFGESSVDEWPDGKIHGSGLKRAALSGYRLLHFAVGGVLDEENLWRTGLSVSLEGPDGKRTDEGFLPVPEIFNLEWTPQLVTLSHTQVSFDGDVVGQALVGLVQSIFYAGSPVVVMSLWDGDDLSTSEFMDAFYQRLRQGQSTQAALRAAKLELIHHGPFHHPAYWSRFIVLGDGERTIPLPSIAQSLLVSIAASIAVLLIILGVFLRKSQHRALKRKRRPV